MRTRMSPGQGAERISRSPANSTRRCRLGADQVAIQETYDRAVSIAQVVLALAVLILWLLLLNSWRLRNWRAVTVGAVGTIAIIVAGMLPSPARALAQAGIWLLVGWIFLFRPGLVGVMPRGGVRLRRCTHPDPAADRSAKARIRPTRPADSLPRIRGGRTVARSTKPTVAVGEVHRETVREMERRLTVMKARTLRSTEDLRPFDDRWLEVGRLFRQTLKARAGFWTGWPYSVRRSGS